MAPAIKQALFHIVINRCVWLPLRHVNDDVSVGGRLSSEGGEGEWGEGGVGGRGGGGDRPEGGRCNL